jgi:hypothetical protein
MIAISTSEGVLHILENASENAINDYSTSANTRRVLTESIAADNYITYTPPEPEPPTPEPNPAAFRAALASTPSWLAWAATLSSVSYTNLAIAAAAGNWVEAVTIYRRIVLINPPPPASIAEWQALAAANAIPLDFGGP